MVEPLPHFSETGRWDVPANMRLTTPFRAIVEDYLEGLDSDHLAIIEQGHRYLSEQRLSDPTHASPRVMALGAVAAHQETQYIIPTLTQYAKQKATPPHQINLFCNWPRGANQTAVGKTIDQIERFQYKYPEVPLRYFARELPQDTPIGYIRKILFGTGVSIAASGTQRDVLMMPHDADLTHLDTFFFARTDKAFCDPSKFVVSVTAETRHERSHGRTPHTDSVIAWYDLNGPASNGMFELGTSFSARAGISVGDYDPRDDTSETLNVLSHILQEATQYHPGRVVARGARITSSQRRLVYRLLNGASPTEFWGKGSFHMTDEYRDIPLENAPDITADEAHEHIRTIATRNHGNNLATRFLFKYWSEGRDPIHAQDLALRTLNMARIMLGGPEDLTNEVQFIYPTPLMDRLRKYAARYATTTPQPM